MYTDVPDKIVKSNRLRYNPVSLTSVNLTWGEPFDGNSPITNYTVSCGNCPMTSVVVDSNVTELVVIGLTPGVEYEFKVAAVNKFGRGQDSNTIMAQSATPGMVNKCQVICITCIHVLAMYICLMVSRVMVCNLCNYSYTV